jgi:hypothetical protein
MTIKTIEASESIEGFHEYGMKRWRGLRYIAELAEGEDEKEATKILQQKVSQNLNPSLPIQEETAPVSRELPVVDRRKQTLMEIIADCTTAEELIRVKDEVGKYGLVDVYIDKLDQLQNKQR